MYQYQQRTGKDHDRDPCEPFRRVICNMKLSQTMTCRYCDLADPHLQNTSNTAF